MLLSYGNISIIYILIFFFFFSNLTKYSQLSWSGKRLAEGIRLLFFLSHGSGLSCCSQALDEKKKRERERETFKNERVLSVSLLPPFSHSPCPSLSSSSARCSASHAF